MFNETNYMNRIDHSARILKNSSARARKTLHVVFSLIEQLVVQLH